MTNKVAIITGASSGIGWAVARLAARRGYSVVLNARREDRLRDLAARIDAKGGEALVVPGDIARLEDQQRVVSETVARFGRIDVLVNNAGFPLPTTFTDSSPEDLRQQWDVNVTALSTLTRLALPYIKASHGTIVNIGSSISHWAVPGMGNYAPTKIAVAGLSHALRRELAHQGVNVCLVEPGPIDTEFSVRAGNSNDGDHGPISRLYVPAARAAVPIVNLFEHPRRRIVIPGWMGPLLTVTGGIARFATPLVDAAYVAIGRRSQQNGE